MLYIPPQTYTVFLVAALLFGSVGLAFAIVWLLRQQPTPQRGTEAEKPEPGDRARTRERTQSQGMSRPMKRVFPITPEIQEAPSRETDATNENNRAGAENEGTQESKKQGTDDWDVGRMQEVPNVITDNRLKCFLEPLSYEAAAEMYTDSFIYRQMPGSSRCVRVRPEDPFPTAAAHAYFVLELPPTQAELAPPKTYNGTVEAHGRAPYDFEAKNTESYYVKLSTRGSTRTHWGKDLARAFETAGLQVGDAVRLTNLGATWVDVPVERDGHREMKTVRRYSWHAQPEAKASLPSEPGQQTRDERKRPSR